MNFPHSYTNGNAEITITSDGSRIINYSDELALEYPLNIDVRLSEQCPFGMNEKTGKAVCSFCHESATTNGKSASMTDIYELTRLFDVLPKGTEIAVGINQFTPEVYQFLTTCKNKGLIVNATVNQGHIKKNLTVIERYITLGLINGLGISYRPFSEPIPQSLLNYKNTVVHVITGINTLEEVQKLYWLGVKKILILGEKDFGFNLGKVKLVSDSHVTWYRGLYKLFKLFDVVSFDNLALEQLNVKRYVKDWDTMYQGEYSFYINAVTKTFVPSSRSSDIVPWGDISEYFLSLNKKCLY